MRKKWQKINSDKTWSIFKIMSEFGEGGEKLSNIGPCISIFGSARTKPDNKYYKYRKRAYYCCEGCSFNLKIIYKNRVKNNI